MSKVRVVLPATSTSWSYGSAITSPVIFLMTHTLALPSMPMAPPGQIRVRRSRRRSDTATDCGVRTPAATCGSSGR